MEPEDQEQKTKEKEESQNSRVLRRNEELGEGRPGAEKFRVRNRRRRARPQHDSEMCGWYL